MNASHALLIVAAVILAGIALRQRQRRVAHEREHHIRAYVFPGGVLRELNRSFPQLQLKDLQLAARALRQFFLVHARAQGRVVAMPSKVTDALWHAFILDTRAYRAFCQAAFGAYFNHLPERAMGDRNADGAATWRTWRLACLEENIDPARATRLPLLFAIDAKLGLPGAVVHDPASFKPPANSDSSSGGGCGGSSSDGCGDSGCGGGCGGGD